MSFELYRSNEDITELWNDFSDIIYPLCCSYMSDSLSADKALVKVFIAAMKYQKDFEHNNDARKWLILQTDYICSTMLRQWWTPESDYLVSDDAEPFEDPAADNCNEFNLNHSSDYISANSSINTHTTINYRYPFAGEAIEITADMSNILRLPAKYKLIVYLCCHDGYTTKEISEYISLPQQLVRSRLHSARLLLDYRPHFEKKRIIYKNAYDRILLSESKKKYLLELVISKAHNEEFYSSIIPKDEEEIYSNSLFLPKDYDDKAESIALLKANLPKLVPGAICLIAVIVIMIMYFLKNPL